MKRLFVSTLASVAGLFAMLAAVAAPASAASLVAFNAECAGTLQVTGVGPSGPTSAAYGGPCTGSRLGQGQLQGVILVTGPASCSGGFVGAHTETLTGSNGDALTLTVMEDSCPRTATPNIYDCAGTYLVTSGTGRFAGAAGSSGKWRGVVTFSTTNPGTGTFLDTYSN